MVFFRNIALLFAGALFALSYLQVVVARPGFNLLHYVMIEGVPVLVSGSETIPVPSGTPFSIEETPTVASTPTPADTAQPTAQAFDLDTDSSVASVLATAVIPPSGQLAQSNNAIQPLATTGLIFASALSILYQLV